MQAPQPVQAAASAPAGTQGGRQGSGCGRPASRARRERDDAPGKGGCRTVTGAVDRAGRGELAGQRQAAKQPLRVRGDRDEPDGAPAAPPAPVAFEQQPEAGGVRDLGPREVEQHGALAVVDDGVQVSAQVGGRVHVDPPGDRHQRTVIVLGHHHLGGSLA